MRSNIPSVEPLRVHLHVGDLRIFKVKDEEVLKSNGTVKYQD